MRNRENYLKWVEANREKKNAQQRKYYQANKEACAQMTKAWKENNKEAVRLQRATDKHKRREREESVVNDLTKEDIKFLELLQANKCASCGTNISNGNYHIDHIYPVSKGGGLTLSNVQLLCSHCNESKSNKTIDYIGYYMFTGNFGNDYTKGSY